MTKYKRENIFSWKCSTKSNRGNIYTGPRHLTQQTAMLYSPRWIRFRHWRLVGEAVACGRPTLEEVRDADGRFCALPRSMALTWKELEGWRKRRKNKNNFKERQSCQREKEFFIVETPREKRARLLSHFCFLFPTVQILQTLQKNSTKFGVLQFTAGSKSV